MDIFYTGNTAPLVFQACIDGVLRRQMQAHVQFNYGGDPMLTGLPLAHPEDPDILVTVGTGSQLDRNSFRPAPNLPGAYEYTQEIQLRTVP